MLLRLEIDNIVETIISHPFKKESFTVCSEACARKWMIILGNINRGS